MQKCGYQAKSQKSKVKISPALTIAVFTVSVVLRAKTQKYSIIKNPAISFTTE